MATQCTPMKKVTDCTCLAESQSKRPSPRLILAPMQVLADRQFRHAARTVGGMDEMVQEFIRITLPEFRCVKGAIRSKYDPNEVNPIPLAAQIMGGNPEFMATATTILAEMGAKRVDLNCGCPSRRVNGRGAGASLLKEPDMMFEIAKSMVSSVKDRDTCVSVKMRSGYESALLFEENVLALKQAGVHMITVHPRTKVQGYSGKADWGFIHRAKTLCGDSTQVVGNGDITNAADAVQMLQETGCDHVMVGRGAVSNPWIFWEIRAAFEEYSGFIPTGELAKRNYDSEKSFYEEFVRLGEKGHGSLAKISKMKVNRLKMMLNHASWLCQEERILLLRYAGLDVNELLSLVLEALRRYYVQKDNRVLLPFPGLLVEG